MGRTYEYSDKTGSLTWTQGNTSLIKAIGLFVPRMLKFKGSFKVKHGHILSDLVSKGHDVVFLPSHFTDLDGIYLSSFCFLTTGKLPYHMMNSNAARFVSWVKGIPIERIKDAKKRVKRLQKKHPKTPSDYLEKKVTTERILRRKLVYFKILPGLLDDGEIISIFPQGKMNFQKDIKPVKMHTVRNIVDSARRTKSGRKVYAIPIRLTYTKPTVRKAGVTYGPFGSKAVLDLKKPILLNGKGSLDLATKRVDAHLRKELKGLIT